MERLDVNKSFLEELAQHRDDYYHGNYGYIINRGNGYCFKVYKRVLDGITNNGQFNISETESSRDLELLERLDKIRKSLYPIEPPVAGIFYDNNYIGNIQIYYDGYESIRNGTKNKKIDNETMFTLLSKILEMIRVLANNDTVYSDMHYGNLIYKDNDVKLIDLDDGIRIECKKYMKSTESMYDFFCRYMLQYYFREYHLDLFLSKYRDFNYENSSKYLEYVSTEIMNKSK